MDACKYINLYFYQDGNRPHVRLTLNEIHRDGSEERVVYRLPLDAISEFTDMEDFARQALAAAIEAV